MTVPNAYLQAAIDLDESVALWLQGNIASAIEIAERGGAGAEKIGWSQGRRIAYGNLACLYVCAGRLTDAQAQIRLASREPFLSFGAENALADTQARALLARGDYQSAEKALSAISNEEQVQPWYRLTVELTRMEFFLMTGRWSEVVSKADSCIKQSDEAKLRPLATAFRLAKSEALIETKASNDELDLTLRESHGEWSLRLVGSFYSVLGKGLSYKNQLLRGASQSDRAIRVLKGVGDLMAAEQVNTRLATNLGNVELTSASGASVVYLDSAVALLELSGNVQVFGPEVFVLFKNTGCTEALALAVRGKQNIRVLDVHGWDTAEAFAALRSAHSDDILSLGRNGEETWEILARPRRDLEHRCTFASIRKLVTTASALDQYRRDEKQRAALWPAEALDGDTESLWVSEQSLELVTLARRLASSPLPLLITGETGTGKEMLARAIHRASNRAERPLVPVNCTAVPRELLESQLFGYRRGAFTGADTAFPGIVRSATGGTLFLDEIGDVNIDLQPKLLRFIEHGEVQPLGEPQAVKVDVRIIAATNANLESLVAQGRFRDDLLYRLKILTLHVPPLRERREEIPALLQHYLQKCGDEQQKGRLTLSDETLEYLLLYSWPGNIRQLANEVRRMIALAEPDSTLTPALLSPEIQASRRTVPAADAAAAPEMRVLLDQPLPAAVDALEQTLVRHALQRSHGRVEEAARMLGISRKGLFLKRRRWGLQRAS